MLGYGTQQDESVVWLSQIFNSSPEVCVNVVMETQGIVYGRVDIIGMCCKEYSSPMQKPWNTWEMVTTGS